MFLPSGRNRCWPQMASSVGSWMPIHVKDQMGTLILARSSINRRLHSLGRYALRSSFLLCGDSSANARVFRQHRVNRQDKTGSGAIDASRGALVPPGGAERSYRMPSVACHRNPMSQAASPRGETRMATQGLVGMRHHTRLSPTSPLQELQTTTSSA